MQTHWFYTVWPFIGIGGAIVMVAILLVTDTFRMGGHATHDEREARTLFDADTFRHWGARDPVGMYEAWLEEEGIARAAMESIEAEVTAEVDAAAEEALRSRDRAMPTGETVLQGVYAAA